MREFHKIYNTIYHNNYHNNYYCKVRIKRPWVSPLEAAISDERVP